MKKILNCLYAAIQTERVKKELKRYCEVEFRSADVHSEYTKLISEYHASAMNRGIL